MDDHQGSTIPIPQHFTFHWAIAVREAVRSFVMQDFPELGPYWPLVAGMGFDAYWVGEGLVALVLKHLPVDAVMAGPSEPRPRPDEMKVLDRPASLDAIRQWVDQFQSVVGIRPVDAVVVLPVTLEVTAEQQWDHWTVAERENWAAQINEFANYHYLIAQARSGSGAAPDSVPELRSKPGEHPSFPQPDDPNAGLWRYMSIEKLVSVLETQALWFSRADHLGDPHEGARSQVNLDLAPEIYHDAPGLVARMGSDHVRSRVFINCWHMAEYESVAMWGLYTKNGEGVAIRSSFQRLVDSLPSDGTIFTGQVAYLDYSTNWIPEGNLFDRFMRKRLNFEYEREVRAVTADWDSASGSARPTGKLIEVDLNRLIVELVVAPEAPESFVDRLLELLGKSGLEVPVRHSDIDADPIL